MRLLHPDSIAGRTMIVLLVGLTLSHIAGTALLSNDRRDAMVQASERVCADQVAVMARFLDRTAPGARPDLTENLSNASLTVRWSDRPTVKDEHQDEEEIEMVAEALRAYFEPVDHPRLHVIHRQMASKPQGHDKASLGYRLLHGFPKDRIMEVSFQLSDGSWANFDVAMARSAALWSANTVVSTLIMMLAIVILGSWATGWVSKPLAAFARAADRLGRDVTAPPLPENGPMEVRHAVAALNEMQGRIRRFVEDRTRMLAAISHDLRSPITRLRLRTEMLPDAEPRDRMLADLVEMEAMVASTLEFARAEAADQPTQAIDLAATLAAICDNVTDMGLTATYAWQGRLICTCRPTALRRALSNLIENAACYGKGAVVQAQRHNSTLIVVIEDQGPGIPVPEQEKVFTPFYRIEASRNRKTGGIGLGMTVARTVIRAHGGDIRLENREEGGLRVTVILPQDTGSNDRSAVA